MSSPFSSQGISWGGKMALAILALLIISTFLIYLWQQKRTAVIVDQPIAAERALIAEITLGALADHRQIDIENPDIERKVQYTDQDLLAVKIRSHAHVVKPIEVNARLLTAERHVVELNPPQFVLPPGTQTFCCWQVAEPGQYTLQLFRPEGVITSIPLTIRRASATPNPLPL